MPPDAEKEADIARVLRDAGCVYAEDEAHLLIAESTSAAHLREIVERRRDGEPLEYIVGWADFAGLRVGVREGVFVPRRRTEFLAACALELATQAQRRACASERSADVLDLCCGSGAIALVIATEVAGARLCAVDDSHVAVECARANLAGCDCAVLLGDLFEPLRATEWPGFDVIVANAPYVPSDMIETLPAEARCFEPRSTLDGGPDGLDVQRRIFAGARDWLRPDGCILVETSGRQARGTELAASACGFDVEVRESPSTGAAVAIARPVDALRRKGAE